MAEKSKSTLEDLKIELKSRVKSIRRLEDRLDQGSIPLQLPELQCRLDCLNASIEKANHLQEQIEDITGDDAYAAELEELIIVTKGKIMSLIAAFDAASETKPVSSSAPAHARLPKLALPKFSGKHSEFQNFISLFERLVHSDNSIPVIEKFNHLISCLSDEALGTIKAFQVTEANYEKAMAGLKRVYDNDYLIFTNNISTLFNLPRMSHQSASSLRTLIDTVSSIYGSLLSIGDDTKISNAMLIHLDPVTKQKWDEQLTYEKLPLWSDLEKVLNRRYQHLSAEESTKPRQDKVMPSKQHNRSSFACSSTSTKSRTQQTCSYCNSGDHVASNCPSFSRLSVMQRFEFAKSASLCINCLRKGHAVVKCKAIKCRVCSRSHHTLLHRYTVSANSLALPPRQESPSPPSNQNQPSTSHVLHATALNRVILATSIVSVRTKSGEHILARALLDSGSQTNFITEDLANRLQIRREESCINLLGIGESNSQVKDKIHTVVKSRINGSEFSFDFWILKSISGYHPDQSVNVTDWRIPENLPLAAPYFYKPQRIDMLIGAESFFEILAVGQIKQGPDYPTLQKTLLGWVVSGKYVSRSSAPQITNSLSCSEELLLSIDRTLKKFWSLEEMPSTKKIATPEHKLCEEHYRKTTQVLSSGRFEVRLPFKSDPNCLGNSFEVAKRRFLSLERRLHRDPELKKMYLEFMEEYLSLGHMSPTDNTIPSTPHYVIPHQCVLRPQSTSTKLRVVFDASSKTSSQVALNDILMVGPTIQEELYSTLLRFRLHRFALTADVKKMYRQVMVNEADRQFQLIVWRRDPSESLRLYKLNTVTYGTGPAPFLAIRCLKRLSESAKLSFLRAANVIGSDFYVDDLLTGAACVKELRAIKSEVSQVLQTTGFELTKWFSNSPEITASESTAKPITISDSESTKALGISWLPTDDAFKFKIDNSVMGLRATKRNILSVTSKLFDPLGLLSPIVIKGKILLQELWLNKLDWDESIPLHLETARNKLKNTLSQLEDISISRFVYSDPMSPVQIHAFADASMRAYGACVYIRSRTAEGLKISLLTSKSKVAPLKTKTLPRLELCAAHLLADLCHRIKPLLNVPIERVVYWSDSEVTLYWIRSHPSSLSTFVSNRVAEIQEWSDDATWRHVPTKQNPADIVSRGCDVDEIVQSIWVEGPSFLKEEEENWPKNAHFEHSDDLQLEKRKTAVGLTAAVRSSELLDVIEGFSSHLKLLRVFVYVFRFIRKCKDPSLNFEKTISPTEYNEAFYKIVEIIQHHEYQGEIEKVRKGSTIGPSLQRLNPFIHEDTGTWCNFSLLRVGGRLAKAPILYDAKFPLLLTKRSQFVRACEHPSTERVDSERSGGLPSDSSIVYALF
ncbi:uncharacterized protein LOC117189926 isoform X3 [Drosophila miranda]|uniref:uncharacterized protein LOC117189926 isoform X2 n=1 Tax=Drosophila miranda TaxID=7229 RepID=UPI00143F6A18|nr:uncharacterized protein LOC117189926 isoform X2 [Drosophila miranda]XP_033250891.1 uncharacterized protein LOC117189926 isoform X3 [Drosophila miranda]